MMNPHPSDALIGLIRSALRLELDGREFYRQAASVTAHPSGKRMFLRLADQEQNHFEELGALFSDLVGVSEWRRIAAEEAANTQKSPIIAQLEAAVAARGHGAVADDTQALRIAMELERRALSFFNGLIEHAADPRQRALLQELAEEERFHYDCLQAQLDSVLNVGIWLDAPEFRLDAKF
ncbi:ferritin family protein [uncultured Thiodictyon sp.]|uniref:ferritin family protein n=1 Tax=uncultured Thiodictyon sp. TaxID=1846217 RepID=UPI0025D9A5B6|nr:ferritin family protein [uncultured Thiodictyon sp.]